MSQYRRENLLERTIDIAQHGHPAQDPLENMEEITTDKNPCEQPNRRQHHDESNQADAGNVEIIDRQEVVDIGVWIVSGRNEGGHPTIDEGKQLPGNPGGQAQGGHGQQTGNEPTTQMR